MTPDQLLSMLPNTVLGAMLFWFIKREAARFEKERMVFSSNLDDIKKTLTDMDKKSVMYVTLEQIGRLGDRLDGRITNVNQDIAVLKDRYERGK